MYSQETMEKQVSGPAFVAQQPLGDSLIGQIGNTPLVPLKQIATTDGISPEVSLFAKVEWFNASGSVKARPALAMILEGERLGQLTPGKTIIDATSGNTGIAIAMIGAAKGYKVKLVMPENVSDERKKTLKAYGAELVLTDPLEGIDHAIRATDQIIADNPDAYFRPDQYNNPVNWQSHYCTTGEEIWEQTHGQVTHFVAGLGTSGTFMGVSRRLKDHNPVIQTYAVEPIDEIAIIEGLKHMESSIVPGIYDPDYPDYKVGVLPNDARAMAKRLTREEGLFAGYSAGAAAWAAVELAKTLDRGVIVTVFPDGGERYLSIED